MLRRRAIRVLGFRNLRAQEVELGPRITLLWGPNGAGKTNLLEALYFALGRPLVPDPQRARDDRLRRASGAGRGRASTTAGEVSHLPVVARPRRRPPPPARRQPRRARSTPIARPPVAVFLPDRLSAGQGPAGGPPRPPRRLLAALWPARAEVRRRYGQALAQRNALLGRIRAGIATEDSLDAWDASSPRAGIELIEARRDAVELLAPEFASAALGAGPPRRGLALRYRPRSDASDPRGAGRRARRAARAPTSRAATRSHGPHLDELEIAVGGRALRRYGSQGEQRAALLALLFAERRALLEARRNAAADAARRRDERARPGPPGAPVGAACRGRRARR